MVYPSALCWVDIETPGLPVNDNYKALPILEIAGVVTDFDLMKFNGVHDCVKLTKQHADLLKAQPKALEMHKQSGLLVDCSKSTNTEKDLEEQMIELLKKSSFSKGEYVLAGSGVASFDFPLLKARMPELASWFTYYVVDVGILRRTVYYLSHGRNFLEKNHKDSFKDGFKKHRALDDVLAHIGEAESYKKWLRSLPEINENKG